MFKIISNEEYTKLIGDVDYWKKRALKEKSFCKGIRKERNFYENLYKSQKVKGIELIRENEELKIEIKHLKEPKAILNIDITSEELAQKIVKELNKNEEHKCTSGCFGKHVIKAIQNDYDSINFKNTMIKHHFTNYWYEKLSVEYTWLKGLYIIDGKIYFSN